MKLLQGLLALLLLAASAAWAQPAPFKVGQSERWIEPEAGRHWRGATRPGLHSVIWYPSDRRGSAQPAPIGTPQQPLFKGHPLVPHAPVAAGRHPLLLLSHGTGGSAGSLDWIAAGLAEQGYIVVGVNHPGNNALEPLTSEGFLLWWERATDLRQALDAMLADPQFAPHIARERIGALGFSLGGYSVLALAGARTDRQAFLQFCASPAADATCRPPEMATAAPDGLTLDDKAPETQASLARSGASFRDPRIRAAFLLAPALGQAFGAATLRALDIPLAIMAGDGDSVVPVASNARWYASQLPQAEFELVGGGAGHYVFLDECLPAAMERLAPICQDAVGVDRAAIHQRAIAKAVGFFGKTL